MGMDKSRAREIADIIENHTELWDQSRWTGGWPGREEGEFAVDEMRDLLEALKNDMDPAKNLCGTTGCVGGWAASLYSPAGSKITRYDSVILPRGFQFKGQSEIGIEFFGREMLGLSPDQAIWLFNGERTQEQVLWALKNNDANWDVDDCPFYDEYADDDDEDYDEDE